MQELIRRCGSARSRTAATLLLVLPALVACTSLSFAVANAPVLFGARQAELRYMDGPRGLLDFYPAAPAAHRASTATAGPAPLVVFFYGGGFEHGRKSLYRFAGAALAARGYPTVLSDYRLYPQVRFPVFLEDAASAVAYAQQHAAQFGADPRRIVLAGHSAGAYIAAMLALNPQYLQRVGVDPRSIAGLVGLSGPYAILPDSAPLDRVFAAPFTPQQWQPLQFAGAGDPPALLLHGGDDTLVRVSHTQRLADALQAAGVEVQLRIYPRRGHADTVAGLSQLARRPVPTLDEIGRFIAALQPRAN